MNLLFVCSENRLRSPTGEEVFSKYEGINAIGAGTNSDAETPVSGDLIEWADIIFVGLRGLVWVPNCDFIAVQPYNSSVVSSSG